MVTKEGEHHLRLYEVNGQKACAAFFPFDCVKFNDRGIGMFFHVRGEVFKSTSDPALLIHFDLNGLFSGAEAYFPLEVQVHGREYTCIDVAVDGAFAHHDLIPVSGAYVVRGLLVFDKRRDQFVEEPYLFFREGNAGPALGERELIRVVSGPGIIELLFQGAFNAFWAAVADIRGPGKSRTLFFPEITAEGIAHRTPAAECVPAVSAAGTADMGFLTGKAQ